MTGYRIADIAGGVEIVVDLAGEGTVKAAIHRYCTETRAEIECMRATIVEKERRIGLASLIRYGVER